MYPNPADNTLSGVKVHIISSYGEVGTLVVPEPLVCILFSTEAILDVSTKNVLFTYFGM